MNPMSCQSFGCRGHRAQMADAVLPNDRRRWWQTPPPITAVWISGAARQRSRGELYLPEQEDTTAGESGHLLSIVWAAEEPVLCKLGGGSGLREISGVQRLLPAESNYNVPCLSKPLFKIVWAEVKARLYQVHCIDIQVVPYVGLSVP